MVVTSKTTRYREKTLKVYSITGTEGPEGEQRYSSTLSLTSALDGGRWSTPRPSRFTPAKENQYPLYRSLGGPQGRFGRVRKISPRPGFDPRTVRPAASRYTDYANPARIQRKHTNTKCYSRHTGKKNAKQKC
jgi:hypothetical protein